MEENYIKELYEKISNGYKELTDEELKTYLDMKEYYINNILNKGLLSITIEESNTPFATLKTIDGIEKTNIFNIEYFKGTDIYKKVLENYNFGKEVFYNPNGIPVILMNEERYKLFLLDKTITDKKQFLKDHKILDYKTTTYNFLNYFHNEYQDLESEELNVIYAFLKIEEELFLKEKFNNEQILEFNKKMFEILSNNSLSQKEILDKINSINGINIKNYNEVEKYIELRKKMIELDINVANSEEIVKNFLINHKQEFENYIHNHALEEAELQTKEQIKDNFKKLYENLFKENLENNNDIILRQLLISKDHLKIENYLKTHFQNIELNEISNFMQEYNILTKNLNDKEIQLLFFEKEYDKIKKQIENVIETHKIDPNKLFTLIKLDLNDTKIQEFIEEDLLIDELFGDDNNKNITEEELEEKLKNGIFSNKFKENILLLLEDETQISELFPYYKIFPNKELQTEVNKLKEIENIEDIYFRNENIIEDLDLKFKTTGKSYSSTNNYIFPEYSDKGYKELAESILSKNFLEEEELNKYINSLAKNSENFSKFNDHTLKKPLKRVDTFLKRTLKDGKVLKDGKGDDITEEEFKNYNEDIKKIVQEHNPYIAKILEVFKEPKLNDFIEDKRKQYEQDIQNIKSSIINKRSPSPIAGLSIMNPVSWFFPWTYIKQQIGSIFHDLKTIHEMNVTERIFKENTQKEISKILLNSIDKETLENLVSLDINPEDKESYKELLNFKEKFEKNGYLTYFEQNKMNRILDKILGEEGSLNSFLNGEKSLTSGFSENLVKNSPFIKNLHEYILMEATVQLTKSEHWKKDSLNKESVTNRRHREIIEMVELKIKKFEEKDPTKYKKQITQFNKILTELIALTPYKTTQAINNENQIKQPSKQTQQPSQTTENNPFDRNRKQTQLRKNLGE